MANGIDVSAIDFSKPRVRYKGKVQDKCALLLLKKHLLYWLFCLC